MDDRVQKATGIFLIDFLSKLSKRKIVVHSIQISPETRISEEPDNAIGITSTGKYVLTITYENL